MSWLQVGADRWQSGRISAWAYTIWLRLGRFWLQVEFGRDTKEYAAEMAALKEA